MSVVAIAWRLVLVLGGLVALVPVSISDLGPHPHAISSYAAAVAVVERQRSLDSLIVAPGGEPILLVHGARTPRVIVLLHGFTNSPLQFLPLARQLFAEGDNVYVPRMPHHALRGTDVGALASITAEELRDCADSAVDIALGLGDSVIVSGLSLGGAMTAWIAVFRPEVRRDVIIAPLLAVARIPDLLQEPAMNLALRLPNVNQRDAPDTSRPDRDLGLSTRAVGEILRLGATARHAPTGDAPRSSVALLLNAHDRTIANGPARDLVATWAHHGTTVSSFELPDSLRLPHDVIDITNPEGNVCVVYPIVDMLIHGLTPPAIMAAPSASRPGGRCQ